MIAMMFIVGFVTFSLVMLYREQDISEPLRTWAEGGLARRGWKAPTSMTEPPHRSGLLALLARFTWKVLSCPYCLGMYVAFFATWFALDHHPWSRAFWLTWLGAWGLHSLLTSLFKVDQSLTALADQYTGPEPDTEERHPE